jgi:hypothetical protein
MITDDFTNTKEHAIAMASVTMDSCIQTFEQEAKDDEGRALLADEFAHLAHMHDRLGKIVQQLAYRQAAE